jgi:hypothetical protein
MDNRRRGSPPWSICAPVAATKASGLLDRRHGDDRRRVDHRRLITVHLLGGEYRRCAGKEA